MKKLSLLLISLLTYYSSYSQEDILIVDEIYTKSIKKIAKNSKVKDAFKYIIDVEGKTNKNLIELTEIEAPPLKRKSKRIC